MSFSTIGKHSIKVDVADLADGDSIAAYLVSASGTLITSASILGNESLRVVAASEFAEDSVHASGDRGVQALAVRHDSDASGLVSADGDYAPLLVDELGRLKVSATVDVESDTSYAEDSPFTNGDLGTAVLLVRQDTLATSTSADADYGSFKSTNLGELYVSDVAARASLVSILAELASISQIEDAAHASGDTGVMSLAVRNDTPGSLVSANGDYAPLQVDALGNLRVVGSITIAGQYAEDSAAVNADIGLSILGVRKDALTTNVSADGDYATPIMWSEGSLKVVDVPNLAIASAAVVVDTTAGGTSLGAAMVQRRSIQIQNRGNKSIFIGATGVTAASGMEIPNGATQSLDLGPAVTVFAITATGTADVRVLQLS